MLLAVDTGGTKTLVTGFDRNGSAGEMHRFATPKDPEDYIAHLTELVHEHYSQDTIDGIVIAVPGVIKDNRVVWCQNLPWHDFDIAAALTALTKCPIILENDANLAGLAETKVLPEVPGLSLYVTISTGIGTGIITHGLLDPALGGSEGGHMLIEYDGKVRTWESFASGRAIKRTYGDYARNIHDLKVWKQIADKISRGFFALIPVLQPDVIIIGGSIGTYFDQYDVTLRRLLKEHLPPHIVLPEIRQAAHPEEAVLYGCYYYGATALDR